MTAQICVQISVVSGVVPLPKPVERQARSSKTSTTDNSGPSLEVQLDDGPEEESIKILLERKEVSATTDVIEEYGSVGGAFGLG